jgi:hypothetical protein
LPYSIFIICSFDAVTVIIGKIDSICNPNVVKIAKPNNRQLKTSVGSIYYLLVRQSIHIPTIIPETDKVRKRAASMFHIFFI